MVFEEAEEEEEDDGMPYGYPSRGSNRQTKSNFGDRMESRGMSKTAKKDEFRISKKRKKRKEKESGPKYAEEDEFGDFQGHEAGYDPVFDP